MSEKEKLLRKLSNEELLELAKSLTRTPIDSRATRTELIRIVKSALSVEEIKRKRRKIETAEHIRVRKRNQFLAVLVISIVAYSSLVFGCASILINVNAKELPVEEKWSRTYDVGQYSAVTAEGTLDGGYIMIGWKATANPATCTCLLKTDSVGNIQWNMTITEQFASSVGETSDGGYIIGGPLPRMTDSSNLWLVKVDSNGTVLWSNDHPEIGNNSVLSVRQTSDGGYIIAGATTDYPYRNLNFWAEKTDQDGKMSWSLLHGVGYAFSAQETPDGAYIIAGVQSGGILLVKTYSNGWEQWSRLFYEDQKILSGVCLEQTSDGGYVIAGYVTSSVPKFVVDFWLGKIDQDGNMEWNRTYGGNNIDAASWVQQTGDGGYILAGDTYPQYADFPRSVLFVKTDPTGNLVWEGVYRKAEDDNLLSIQQRSDGGYVIAEGSLLNGTIWLAEIELGAPSALLVVIPVTLTFSGIAVTTCLVMMGRRLKRSREGLTTDDENVVHSDKALSAVSLAMFAI